MIRNKMIIIIAAVLSFALCFSSLAGEMELTVDDSIIMETEEVFSEDKYESETEPINEVGTEDKSETIIEIESEIEPEITEINDEAETESEAEAETETETEIEIIEIEAETEYKDDNEEESALEIVEIDKNELLDAVLYKGEINSSIKWEIDSNYQLKITGSGAMPNFLYKSRPSWYQYRSQVKSIVIGEGITSIGNIAFSGFSNATSVSIASTVTEIGSLAFYGNEKLTSVTGMAGVKIFKDNCFEETGIKSFTFPKKTEQIGLNIFSDSDIVEITIPASVSSIEPGFAYKAEYLEKITVDSGNAKYSSTDGILFDKQKTKIICYPAAKKNTSYTIPNSVKTIEGYAFAYLKNTTSLTIPSSVTVINDAAFSGMTASISLTIPSTVISVGQYLFKDSKGLKTLDFNASVEKTTYQMCQGCTSLSKVVLSNDKINEIYGFSFAGCISLSSVTLPSKVEKIGAAAFQNCSRLTGISYPSSILFISGTAFSGSGITSIPSWLMKNSSGDYVRSVEIKYSGKYDYSLAYKVLDLVNQKRKANGLNELKMDKELLEAAMKRAGELAIYYSYYRPNGSYFTTISSKALAENHGTSDASAANPASDIMGTWMYYGAPKSNIYTNNYTSTGIGCVIIDGVCYWVELFGKSEPSSFTKPENKDVTIDGKISGEYVDASELKISAASTELVCGDKEKISVSLKLASEARGSVSVLPSSLTWSSSNSSVVSVSTSGEMTAKGVGTATITAAGFGLKATLSITVKAGRSAESVTINKSSSTNVINDKLQLKATVTPSNASQSVKWTSSDSSIASVNDNGLVTMLKRGKVTITATAYIFDGKTMVADGSVTAKCSITINFTDIGGLSSSFQKAINWIADQGIVMGYSDGRFGESDGCTRKQFSIMLWRFAGKPAVSGSIPYKDVTAGSNSDTYKAILWTSQQGITKGYSDGTFRPNNGVTRQQVMIMLYRYSGKPAVSGKLPFTDVNAGVNSDTYKAILWGSTAGITNGTSATKFSPNSSCLRRQIAMFLYKYSRL